MFELQGLALGNAWVTEAASPGHEILLVIV